MEIHASFTRTVLHKMYCFECGKENPEWARFCCSCGKEQPTMPSANSPSTSQQMCTSRNTNQSNQNGIKAKATTNPAKTKSVLSFSDFKKRKTSDRSSFLVSKKGKGKAVEENVTIQVGQMTFNSRLKPSRGRLPLIVRENASVSLILSTAVKKYGDFEKSFNKDREYVLLYPDGSEVVTVPGTTEPFTLGQYKRALGKPYSRITLFICTKTDFLFDSLPKNLPESDSDSDPSPGPLDNYFERETKIVQQPQVTTELEPEAGTLLPVPAISDNTQLVVIDDPGPYQSIDSDVNKVQCPLCFLPFPLQDIAEHADGCNSWQPEPELIISDDEDIVVEETKNPAEDEKSSLMNAIQTMSSTINAQEKVRINIRRKFLWDDFKQARAHKVKAAGNLKVIFVGECAIDDGGPRREFFTGIYIKY